MKLRLCISLFILSTVFAPLSVSQKKGSLTDSLENALSGSQNRHDSLQCLVRLTWDHSGTNDELAIQYGLSALELIGGITDSSLIADAYDAAALASEAQGNINRAKELFQTSLELGQRQNIPLRMAWANYHLEVIALNEGDIETAGEHASRAFQNFSITQNYGQAYQCYWQLIDNHQNEYLDTLIGKISDMLPDMQDETQKIFFYLELTNLYNHQGDRNRAMLNVQHAMELADKNKNIKGIIKAYNQIALYFIDVQKNYEMALKYYHKALEYIAPDRSLIQADLLLNIGEVYSQLNNDSLALDYFNQALQLGQQYRHKHTKASAYMKMGEINYRNKNFRDARYFYSKSYETNCDVCPRIKFHQALVNIGHVYLLENEFKMAEQYYRMGSELADSFSDLRAQVISLQSFARLHEKQNKLQKAISFEQEAYAKASDYAYLEGKQESAAALSRLYQKVSDYQQAYRYLDEANRLSDSISRRNEIENLGRLETYFDFRQLQAQKEFEKVKAQEAIRRQKLLGRIYISGATVIGIFGLLLFYGYRRKKYDNKVLKEQKMAIEEMSKKVHEADQLKLQFFTNISHEFKTPLTLILGMTEKLREKISESPPVDMIRKNAIKLLQLVNHLLDLRKVDTMQMKLRVREDDLVKFIKGVTGSFESLAQQKKIELKVITSEEEKTAFFDHEKLEKIISNLLSNALKFTPAGGKVEIHLSMSDQDTCLITFRDNGLGIPPKEMKNIFRRFYRIDQNGGHGTGIGLALVKELVDAHHGSIQVAGNNQGGTSFIINLPIQKDSFSAEEMVSEPYEMETAEYANYVDLNDPGISYTEAREPDDDKKIILIVEDNLDLRNYLAGLFADKFEILEAADGLQGYQLAHKHIPDIVISDIMMPEISGLQLVEKLKTNATTSHIPIILLTAKNDLGSRLSGFEKGADEYISKPFESSILLSRVENLLRLRKQLAEKFTSQFRLQPREITIENADKVFLEKTIRLIEEHIADPNLNVDFLCLELGVSRTQLYRKLNALTEYPPKHFIRIIRLKRAAQILRQGQNNIAEVMDATGFSNYSYFNNCFKEFFGEYPKDYALVSIKGNLN